MSPVEPPERHSHPVIDPVCGRELEPDPRRLGLSFRGRRWYFCDDPERGCRLAFKRDPERWANARPDAGVEARPTVPPPTRGPSPFNVAVGPAPGEDEPGG